MKRLSLLLYVTLSTFILKAYDFEVDGICYNIRSVEERVVFVSSTEWSLGGDYVIPEEVEFNGVKFTVGGIGGLAFRSYWVRSVTIPPTVSIIEDCAFYNTSKSLETLVIQDSDEILDCTWLHGINDLEYGQFTRTSIKNLYLGRDVTFPSYDQYHRYYNPFYEVYTIENIEVGPYVKDIKHLELSLCSNLKTITLHTHTPPTSLYTNYSNVQYVSVAVSVPKGTLDIYKATDPWKYFVNLSEEESNTSKLFFDYDSELGSVYVNRQFVESEIILDKGSNAEITIIPMQDIDISSVLMNGEEKRHELKNNTLYLTNINDDINIVIVFTNPRYMVKLIDGAAGSYSINVERNSSLDLIIEPDKGWSIQKVYVNDVDMTSYIYNNHLMLNSITSDCTINTIYAETIDGLGEPKTDVPFHLKDGTIYFDQIVSSSQRVYDEDGHLLYNGTDRIYKAPQSGVYILIVGERKYKVAI